MTELSGGSVINVELENGGSIDVTLTPGAAIDVEIIGSGPQGPQGAAGMDGAPGADGADGVSPEVTIASITGGHSVTITDVDHPSGQTFNVLDGEDGEQGPPGQDGANGTDGTDGVSPEVTIVSITGGHSVTITDADHPGGQTFNVMDGQDGEDGAPGINGQDGERGTGIYKITTAPTSQTAIVGDFTAYYQVSLATVLSEAGISEVLVGDIIENSYYHYPVGAVDTSYVYTGKRTSIRGTTGATGAAAGFGTPTATVDSNVGTPGVTVTASGAATEKVFNFAFTNLKGEPGTNGADGVGVPSGGAAGQVLKKASSTDYDTEWVTPSAGTSDVEWVTYGSTGSAAIEAAYQAGKIVATLTGGKVYYLFRRDSSADHFFYAPIDTRFYVARCTSDSWTTYYYECLELGDNGTIPSGGNAGQVLSKNSATDYDVHWVNQTQNYPSAYCTTAGATAAKVASCSLWTATANSYLHVLIGAANTSAGALTLNVNSTGAKPICINGTASSGTNYTLPAGSYIVYYDGTNFYFRTDGKLTANITGTADGVAVPDAATATPADLGSAAV
ncbi:MAG: hypothetical protein IJU18_04990, partial [Oscillospiraceae bacterium]|nr:hypothetical protein [Oscillospiraceae bacterium]